MLKNSINHCRYQQKNIDIDFKFRLSEWRGRRDKIIYLYLHNSATVQDMKKGIKFQQIEKWIQSLERRMGDGDF